MLLRFSVKNYLSFKDLTVLEMLPSTIKQHKENIIKGLNYNALKTAAVFGANASGKSNLFRAVAFARSFVMKSSKDMQSSEDIDVKPFLFSNETETEPSLFEFIFIKNNVKYRYGFVLNKTQIIDEWLFSSPKIRESLLFKRHKQDFHVGAKFKEGRQLTELTRENALFLSVTAQFNGEISKEIMEWFANIHVISGLKEYSSVTFEYLERKNAKDYFLKILNAADPSIKDITFKDQEVSALPKVIQSHIAKVRELGIEYKLAPKIEALHEKYDKAHSLAGFVSLDFNRDESSGTKHMFSMIGPILDTIDRGGILFIDEIEANLHPLITQFVIKLFHQKNENAQFVFNTHDTNLLSNQYFRRDQIYFMNKNQFGESYIQSLYDYDVRADKAYEKNYLKGFYKAVPFIDEYGIFSYNSDKK